MTDFLSVRNLNYAYVKNTNVLDNISFRIGAGEIVGLAGSNGSGKTTLIKIISDIYELQSGHIKYFGGEKSIENKKQMLCLPSEEQLPEFLTGYEYLKLLCKFYETTIDDTRLEGLLLNYCLEEEIYHLIESYSHGMKKKLHLISGFIIQPKLLIIDETMNGLDFESKEATKILLKNYITADRTIILCTHDLKLVGEIADRIMFIDAGKIHIDSELATQKQQVIDQMNEFLKIKLAQRGLDFASKINF